MLAASWMLILQAIYFSTRHQALTPAIYMSSWWADILRNLQINWFLYSHSLIPEWNRWIIAKSVLPMTMVVRAAPHKSVKSNFLKNIPLLEAIGFKPHHSNDNVLPSYRLNSHHQKSLSQRGNKQKVSLYSVVACKGKQLRKFWLEVCISLTIWSSFPLQQGAPFFRFRLPLLLGCWQLVGRRMIRFSESVSKQQNGSFASIWHNGIIMHAYRHWRLTLCIASLLS